jgi:hypothetical protein
MTRGTAEKVYGGGDHFLEQLELGSDLRRKSERRVVSKVLSTDK